MPPHIYIDCTETARVGANTGIQRTVRALVAAASELRDVDVAPVRYDGRHFVALGAAARAALARPAAGHRRVHERARRIAVSVLSSHPSQGEWVARGRDLASRSYWAMRRMRVLAGGERAVRFNSGDWLVLLDATWTPDVRRDLARAKSEGARICVVVYDLIKLRRPDLVSPGAAGIYRRWLDRVLPAADLVATISRAVRDDVQEYLRDSGRASLAGRVRHFPLGADFEGGGAPGEASAAVRTALGEHAQRTFLAVGSIEPRKDQATILDAFERLWREGADARLVLVGRPGWGSDALVRRLSSHEARGTRLFWLADASDADLAHCYRRARALVNVSLCEGFGLPLVEAMRHGMRVVASDIPPFREVAGDAAVFVPAGDADALARAVAAMLREPWGAAPAAPVAVATWIDSARALIALLRDPPNQAPR